MKTVQIAKTPKGYIVVDVTAASQVSASFAPATQIDSETKLRSVLSNYGFTQSDIESAITQIHSTGQATISVGPSLQ